MVTPGPIIQTNNIETLCFPFPYYPHPKLLSTFPRFSVVPHIRAASVCSYAFSSPWVPHPTSSSHWKSAILKAQLRTTHPGSQFRSEGISPPLGPRGSLSTLSFIILWPSFNALQFTKHFYVHNLQLSSQKPVIIIILQINKQVHKRCSHRPQLFKCPLLCFQHCWTTAHP